MIIRSVLPTDRAAWGVLWRGYLEFYKANIPDAVTEITWSWFFDAYEPVHCLVVERDATLLGLVHYIFHRNTWMAGPVCYLQDLFTSADARGSGVGRALIETVYAKAQEAGSPRVYWMTHESNSQAMVLYDKVAKKSGFLQYRRDF